MSLYDHYKTNKEPEWIEWGSTGASFLLARANGHDNAKFKATMERKLRKYRTEIRLDVLPDEVQTAVAIEVFADTIVLDWKGVQDAKGKDLPYSRKACIKLFTDLPELFSEVQAVAMDRKTFQDATAETDAKN